MAAMNAESNGTKNATESASTLDHDITSLNNFPSKFRTLFHVLISVGYMHNIGLLSLDIY